MRGKVDKIQGKAYCKEINILKGYNNTPSLSVTNNKTKRHNVAKFTMQQKSYKVTKKHNGTKIPDMIKCHI